MAQFEDPNVSMKKTNEENIQALKSWAINTTDQLNYLNAMLENVLTKLNKLESEE